MEWTKYLVGGAALGAIASFWRQLQALIWRVCNLFIQEVEIREPVVAAAAIGYLVRRYRRVGIHSRAFAASNDHHVREQRRRFGVILFERFGTQTMIFRRGPWPLLFEGSGAAVANGGAEGQSAGGQKSGGGGTSTAARLLFLRGTFDIDHILAEAVKEWNQIGWELLEKGDEGRRRFFIKYLPDVAKDKGGGWTPVSSSWQYYSNIRLVDLSADDVGLGARTSSGMLDRLFYPDEISTLIEEVKAWRKSQDWYQSRGIPWKRGWLLHGKPGTGKTALAGAFAHDLDLPIFVYNLSEMGNMEFMAEWKSMLASVPCIALIEDLDAVFHGRENISRRDHSFERQWSRIPRQGDSGRASSSGGESADFDRDTGGRSGYLSFDVLLNCIDGVDRAEGVFTIITTNHVEHIDPALGQPAHNADGTIDFVSTRPGRIDRAIELEEMKPYVKKRMARHILGDFPEELEQMERHIDAHPDELETPAQFQQRCNAIALNRFWREERRKDGIASGDVIPLNSQARRGSRG